MILGTAHVLAIFQFILLFLPANNCDRKPKNRERGRLPRYEVYQKDILPSDVQVTTFLYKGEQKRLFYKSTTTGALSATVIACRSPVKWTVEFLPLHNVTSNHLITHYNQNSSMDLVLGQQYGSFQTVDMDTHSLASSEGTYTFTFVTLEGETFLHVYISTELGGPQTLQSAKFQELRLLKRQKKRRLTVKWNPSLVDPQGTDYCLVMSTNKPYKSFCAAQSDTFQSPAPVHVSSGSTVKEIDDSTDNHSDPLVTCIGRKTHYTISNLRQGQNYSFFVFAVNHQSNFTYPYSSASTIFDTRVNPATLKDGIVNFANLKKLDGKAVFKYKVGKKSAKSLDLYVVPCGGVVEVEVATKDKKVTKLKRIEGFGKISIPNPVGMERYYIKIFSMNREELKKTTGVEVYATTKSSAKIPLPNMPQEPRVHEYLSLRSCNSVTVGWLLAPFQRTAQYCLVVKEGVIREMDDYKMPNQCGLENRLRKSADFVAKLCRDVRYDIHRPVMTQKVTQLKPGKSYIVQVTVKKPKGKTLSYDLLQIQTKSSCNKQG